MSNNEDKGKLRALLGTSGEMVGSAAGGVLGFFVAGPMGAALGGAASVAISKVLVDIANRSLSQRETLRVSEVAKLAIEKIQSKLSIGEQPRDDDFFNFKGDSPRSDAEEIFEGVLLNSKNEHEEKKIQILANIFANVAFDQNIKIGEANHILQVANDITYRQSCILALFGQKVKSQTMRLKGDKYDDTSGIMSFETISLVMLQENLPK